MAETTSEIKTASRVAKQGEEIAKDPSKGISFLKKLFTPAASKLSNYTAGAMLVIAALIDLLQIILSFTGIGTLLGGPFCLLLQYTLFTLWFLVKGFGWKGYWGKKQMVNKGVTAFIEIFVPVLNDFVPAALVNVGGAIILIRVEEAALAAELEAKSKNEKADADVKSEKRGGSERALDIQRVRRESEEETEAEAERAPMTPAITPTDEYEMAPGTNENPYINQQPSPITASQGQGPAQRVPTPRTIQDVRPQQRSRETFPSRISETPSLTQSTSAPREMPRPAIARPRPIPQVPGGTSTPPQARPNLRAIPSEPTVPAQVSRPAPPPPSRVAPPPDVRVRPQLVDVPNFSIQEPVRPPVQNDGLGQMIAKKDSAPTETTPPGGPSAATATSEQKTTSPATPSAGGTPTTAGAPAVPLGPRRVENKIPRTQLRPGEGITPDGDTAPETPPQGTIDSLSNEIGEPTLGETSGPVTESAITDETPKNQPATREKTNPPEELEKAA